MPTLSKSRYLGSLQCQKRLYFESTTEIDPKRKSEADLRRFREGREVGLLAREHRGEGKLISDPIIERALEKTRQEVRAKTPRLFEAAISAQELLVRPDILEWDESGWHLIEVKASTRVKDQHLRDIAFQLYVCTLAKVKIVRTSVMHINKDCVAPELSNLFNLEDVSDRLDSFLEEIPGHIGQAAETLSAARVPEVPVGSHCKSPHRCPFIWHCWDGVPSPSIFNIPQLHKSKSNRLLSQGVYSLEELPEDFPLTKRQADFVSSYLSKSIKVDEKAIKNALNSLVYPLYYFDIEALGPAVPRYDGMRPFENLCFQFSCHIETASGVVKHHEFLHTEASDPRPAFLEALVRIVGDTGSIVVWNKTFERDRLQEFLRWYPEQSEFLERMLSRLWDQQVCVKKNYQDPAFLGSYSLKSVLPALCPDLSYDDLAIQEGSNAAAMWEKMLTVDDEAARQKIVKDLCSYCQLDTSAMLVIQKVLLGAIA